jgi:integrase
VIEFDGHPIKSIRKAFRHAAEAAGLTGVTPHVLRHTAASWAMQNGADMAATADYLGMTVQVLQSTYGHLHPDQHKDVLRAITKGNRK